LFKVVIFGIAFSGSYNALQVAGFGMSFPCPGPVLKCHTLFILFL